jgi:hypothetical protein
MDALQREQIQSRVTGAIDWLLNGGMPTGEELFDEAWRKLKKDRPRPPKECPLTRRLVRQHLDMIEDRRP